jgi:hypothetical protein
MARSALTATQIWTNPALADEEGVQTRYSTYPMAELLLLTEVVPLNPHSARLTLLNGDAVTAHQRHWSFETTKAIYRNLVRVPYWAAKPALANPPHWLDSHVWQPTAVGLLRAEGSIRWPGDHETGLSYQADQGVIIDRTRVPRDLQEESDESYD